MKCRKCGQQVKQGSDFCASCGEKIERKADARILMISVFFTLTVVIALLTLLGFAFHKSKGIPSVKEWKKIEPLFTEAGSIIVAVDNDLSDTNARSVGTIINSIGNVYRSTYVTNGELPAQSGYRNMYIVEVTSILEEEDTASRIAQIPGIAHVEVPSEKAQEFLSEYSRFASRVEEDREITDPIELAQQYQNEGNYTKAEQTLGKAIQQNPSKELYLALCKAYLAQDKLRDAIIMLDSIPDNEIKLTIDSSRPSAPRIHYPADSSKSQIEISFMVPPAGTTIYYTLNEDYPSIHSISNYNPIGSISVSNGTRVTAVSVDENGLISQLSHFDIKIAEETDSSKNKFSTVSEKKHGLTVAVSYDANGGEGAPQTKYYEVYDEVLNFCHPKDLPSRDGYKFIGWLYQNDHAYDYDQPGTSISFGGIVDSTPLRYYAQWEKSVDNSHSDVSAQSTDRWANFFEQQVWVNSENGLNVRSGPGTGYDIIERLPNGYGTVVLYVESINGTYWGYAGHGWICMDYVTADPNAYANLVSNLELFEGNWADSVGQRCMLEAEKRGDKLYVTLKWSSGASNTTYWEFVCSPVAGDLYAGYSNGLCYTIDTSDGTERRITNYTNGYGGFQLERGKMYWIDALENQGEHCVFEKIVY